MPAIIQSLGPKLGTWPWQTLTKKALKVTFQVSNSPGYWPFDGFDEL